MVRKVNNVIYAQLAKLAEPVAGYSRLVKFIKLSLLALAVIIIAMLVIIPVFSPINENFRITFSHIEREGEGDWPKMVKPRFQGIDNNNQSYNISAESAMHTSGDSILLSGISVDMSLKDGNWVSFFSNEGIFDHAMKMLELRGNVNIFTHDGYEFETEAAKVNMKEHSAYGKNPVRVQGEAGTLTADSFRVEGKGDRVIFKGNVKLVLYPSG